MTTLLLTAVLALDVPQPADASTIPVVWLADLDPATVKSGTVGRWVFVPGSRPDDVTGHWCVEVAGAGDVLRVVSFAKGETDEGLDVVAPIVVEGVLGVIRHAARGQFPAVVELRVKDAPPIQSEPLPHAAAGNNRQKEKGGARFRPVPL